MKKGVCFLFVFFTLIIFLLIVSSLDEDVITGNTISGEAITGEASAQSTNVSVFVLAAIPTLSILSPKNETYLSNESILLDFSVTLEDFVWYNIDSGSNITITSSIFINVSQGSHTLFLYANNSQGTTIKNVSFTANSSIFTIIYNEYAGSTKGTSTDFNASGTYEDLQNLSNIVLENTQSGKITFNEAINLTADSDFSDRVLNLDTNTNISFNRIELDSTTLPNFDKSATLILYGLSFSNPRILRDGSVCSSSICTQNSYSGGSLSFDVTGFTVYSAEETPVTPPPPDETGGGGGGGAVVTAPEIINLDKDIINISLIRGEVKSEELTIRNVGSSTLNLTLFVSGSQIENLLRINESNFSLGVGESKTIIVDFISEENTPLGLYQGKLIVRSGNVKKEVLISIEIESRDLLFDVSVEIPEKFLEIVPGEELLANIKLFNLGTDEEVEVSLDYSIRDGDGNVILSENEIITVKTEISFPKIFKTPRDVKTGDYLLYVRATYNTQLASASVWFKIIPKTFFERILPYLIIIIVLLIIIILIILLVRRLRHELQILRKHKDVVQ